MTRNHQLTPLVAAQEWQRAIFERSKALAAGRVSHRAGPWTAAAVLQLQEVCLAAMVQELERNGWPVSEADARTMAATLMRRAGGAQGLADYLNQGATT